MLQAGLKDLAARCAARIADAKEGESYFAEPYQHLIIDEFLDPHLADDCLGSFPPVGDADWDHANDSDIEIKYRSKWQSEFDIPEHIVDAVRILNSALILRAMASRLDIPKVIPDPYFAGGGLNVTQRGGLLGVHVDGNYHDATGLHRRINAILFLNPGWKKAWGGEFGVYDVKGEHCVKRVAPLHNRFLVFDTHDRSFHGLPDPVNFPEQHPRRSIILYYYTKDPRPQSQTAVEEPHSALWVKRGLLDKRGSKTRAYS